MYIYKKSTRAHTHLTIEYEIPAKTEGKDNPQKKVYEAFLYEVTLFDIELLEGKVIFTRATLKSELIIVGN